MNDTLDERRRANNMYSRERALALAAGLADKGHIPINDIIEHATKFAEFLFNDDNGTKR